MVNNSFMMGFYYTGLFIEYALCTLAPKPLFNKIMDVQGCL